jgi:hypothetical protein
MDNQSSPTHAGIYEVIEAWNNKSRGALQKMEKEKYQ